MPLSCLAVSSSVAGMSDHLLFGDRGCPQIKALVQGARALAISDGAEQPLVAITAALQAKRATGQSAPTLHLIAHGRPGALRFGEQWIDAEALKAHARELAQWGVATIALWSCHVGADANFVALLEELSGARVLASADWLGRDGANEHLQLGHLYLSDLVEPSAWPAQFLLEDLKEEGSESS